MGETYQERLKRIKSQMSNTEGKAKSAGEKVVSAAKSVASQNGSSETGKKSESYSERIARIKKNRKNIVDDNYISSFQKDATAYQTDVKSKYEGLTWQSASSESESMISRSNDLRSRAAMIQNYLSENKDNMDSQSYYSMQKYLSDFNSDIGKTSSIFRDAADFYGQFETEQDYTDWKTASEENERLSNLDIEETEKYLKQLEVDAGVYDNFERAGKKEAMAELDAKYEGGVKKAADEMSKLTEDLATAKRIQNGIELAGAVDAEDFDEFSKYISTVNEDAKWYENDRDEQYEFINDKEFQTKYMAKHDLNPGGKSGFETYSDKNYHMMNENEISIYNYYYAKEGKEKAQEYLDSIQDSLNRRYGAIRSGAVNGNEALEFMFDFAANAEKFGEDLSDFPAYLSGDTTYNPPSDTEYAISMLAQERENDPAWLRTAHDLAGTIGYQIPSLFVSATIGYLNPALGGNVALGMMSGGIAGSAYREKINLGYSAEQAQAYATLIGASEYIVGKVLGGITLLGGTKAPEAIKGMVGKVIDIDSAFAQIATRFGSSMISEGSEEFVQELLEPVLSNLILGTHEEISFKDAAYAGLLGALSAGVLEGPSIVAGEYGVYKQGKEVKASDVSIESLVEMTNKLPADSEAYKLAGKVDEKTGAYKIGRLFNEIGATLTEQNQMDIAKSLVRKGFMQKDADKIAMILADVVAGRELSEEQAAILDGNEYISKTIMDVIINPNSTVNQRSQGYNEALMALANEQVAKKASQEASKGSTEDEMAMDEEIFNQKPKEEIKDRYAEAETRKTVRSSDGAEVNIQSVASVKDGVMTFKLDDGSTATASDLELGGTGVIYSAMADMGVDATSANLMMDRYKLTGGVSPAVYARGITEAYRYGQFNYPLQELAKAPFASELSYEQSSMAYRIGKLDAGKVIAKETAIQRKQGQAKTARQGKVYFTEGGKVSDFRTYMGKAQTKLKDIQETAVVAMEQLSAALGVDFYVFESYEKNGKRFYIDENGNEAKAPNGKYIKGKIYVDLHAGNTARGTMLFTVAHELTHFIKAGSLRQFKRLANILNKYYGEKGVSVEARVQEQIKKAKANGRDIGYDEAFEEYVADSMESVLADGRVMELLADIKKQDTGLWNTIKGWFADFTAKLKNMISAYEGVVPDSKEGRFVAEAKDLLAELQQVFAEGLVEASENMSVEPGESGTVYNAKGDPVAFISEEGSVQLSMRTYEESGREEFRKYLEKCVKSKRLTKAEMAEMRDGIEQIYETCKEFKDKYAPFGTWSEAEVITDEKGKPVFSVVTPNGEYKMNLDFSLVCKKRRTLDAVFNEMAKRGIIDDFELGQKSVVKINEIIRKHGLETACALCFVDAKRFRQAAMADMFVDLYNDLVYSLVPGMDRGKIAHFNFSGNQSRADVPGIHEMKNSELDFSHVDEVMKKYGSGTVEYKAAAYIKRSAEARKLLQRGDFMSSGGFDAVKVKNKTIMSLYNSKKGTGGPKAAFGDAQYLNEVIKKARFWTPKKAYSVGGVRIQSFSDYVPRMVFDYVQMVYDLAATKLPAHAYTKEAMFAKQFGLTGIKINMSLIPTIVEGGIAPGLDANGDYVWAGESFDFETAKKIQNAEGYTENCGTICVGVSYEHIRKLLSDPDIRMVIPYHKSGLNPIVAKMNKVAAFTDYTSMATNPGGCQNTVDKEGKKVEKDFDFNGALRETGDPKVAVQKYFEWCSKNEYTPRFAEFAWHENYYKLIEDFTLYDMNMQYVPQHEVRAVFPTEDSAFGSMKSLIESALEEDAIVEGKRDSALGEIVDEIQQNLPRTEAEIPEVEVEQADRDLEEVKLSDRYLSAEPDDGILALITKVNSGVFKANEKVSMGVVRDDIAERIQNITGIDVKGFNVAIEARQIEHIIKDHGVNGLTDRSMSDEKNIGRMGYVLDNPDDIRPAGKTRAYVSVKSGKNRPADTVLYEKQIGDKSYYVVQAVPETKKRTLYIVTAFIGKSEYKKEAPQSTDANSPGATPKAESASTSTAIIDQGGMDVKYQDRPEESVSNRSLLANAFEGLVQNDIEYSRLQEYKSKISTIEAEERKLQDLNRQIKEISFGTGPRDQSKLRGLREEAMKTANRINIYDKQLIRLEASKPLQDVLGRERARAYERGKKNTRKAMEEYKQRMKEQAERTEMRHKIKRVVNDLNRYLLKGTKDKHVPIQLQRPVALALEAVNMDTVNAEQRIAKLKDDLMKAKTPEEKMEISKKIEHIEEMGGKVNARLEALKSAYDSIVNSEDPLLANAYDEVISGQIDSVRDKVGDTPIREMSLEQLELVHDMYTMILTNIKGANDTFAEDKKKSIEALGTVAMLELDAQRRKKNTTSEKKLNWETFSWNNLKPVHAFDRLGSDTMTRLFKNVRKGEDVWYKDIEEVAAFREAMYEKYKYEEWDFDKPYTFTSTSGMEFKLTIDQIMSLYAYSKRGDQAKDHLKFGGFVYDPKTQVVTNTFVKGAVKVKQNIADSTSYNISEETLKKITDTLSQEQKDFADKMQNYLSNEMSEKGNEVSLKMYAVKLFKEKNYFPLRSATDYMARAKEQAKGDVKIKNKGFTKETTPKAKNPIVLSSFMDVWASHCNEMCMYHAFVLPMEDFYRVYNYQTSAADPNQKLAGVIASIKNAHGAAAEEYIDQLLKDISGGVMADSRENVAKKMTAKFKKAKVMASLSVMIQQPSAIGRAFAYLNPLYFKPTKDGMNHNELWAEVKKYAPVAGIKEMGYFDTNMGMSATDFILGKSNWLDDKLSWLASKADEVTWCAIWNATKRDIIKKQPHLSPKSEEFLKLVGERFTEVITHTQVYDSVMARSANMRSKSGLMGMITSFMAEPTTTANMVSGAIRDFRNGKKAHATRVLASVASSIVLNELLASLVYAARDDDEDETYLEKYGESLITGLMDSLNPLTYLPIVKDVWSLFQGYDIERADMGMWSELADAVLDLDKVLDRDTSGMDEDELLAYQEEVREKWHNLGIAVVDMFGIPVGNIVRDVKAGFNTYNTVTSGKQTTWMSWRDNIMEEVNRSVPLVNVFDDKSKSDKLYDAITSGDSAYVERLESSYKDENSYNNALKKALRDNDARVKQAAEARYNADFNTYQELLDQIVGEGNFDEDVVIKAIEAEMNKLKPKEESDTKKGAERFNMEDFYKAAKSGDILNAEVMRKVFVDELIEEGYLKHEAEESVASSFVTKVKGAYLDGDVTKSEAKSLIKRYGDKTEDEASTEIKKCDFELEHGYSWGARVRGYRLKDISKSDLMEAVMDIEGESREGAEEYIKFLDLEMKHQNFDINASDAAGYFEYAEPAGISVDVYLDYKDSVSGLEGDKDENGKTISGSKKTKILAAINALPISSVQKDALYYANNYKESTLYEAPWH